VVAAVIKLSVLGAGCGSDAESASQTPTPIESQVCAALQTLVDGIDTAGIQSVRDFDVISGLVPDAAGTPVGDAAAALVNTMATQVDDSKLTVDQALAAGRAAMAKGQVALADMINACDTAGAPIERLPTGSPTTSVSTP